MRNQDCRSKRIAFVSSCILNVNHKVRELARYSGASKEIVDLLLKYNIGITQMDCPETLYLGINRWSATRNLYDVPGFRRHCRQLAEKQADYVEAYKQAGYQVVAMLWINGSPSCGYDITCHDDEWGGTPTDFGDASTFVAGKGIFVQELEKEFAQRQLEMPCCMGLNLEDERIPLSKVYEELEEFLEDRCGGV